jgi:thioredoxin-related protein
MKKILNTIILLFAANMAFCQEAKLYNPTANATAEIANAVKQAKSKNKFVLIQAGGNWCGWCLEFARIAKADVGIDSVIKSAFVLYHLNYSKENKNAAIFKKYGMPDRFGFPVFIILNEKGERIHTQDSSYLEDGNKSYDVKKVQQFLENWSPNAFQTPLQ